jgi:hypothetical protein
MARAIAARKQAQLGAVARAGSILNYQQSGKQESRRRPDEINLAPTDAKQRPGFQTTKPGNQNNSTDYSWFLGFQIPFRFFLHSCFPD